MKTQKKPDQLRQEFKNCIEKELITIEESYYNLMKENPQMITVMQKLENSPLYDATFYAYIVKVLINKIEKCKLTEKQRNEN